MNFTPADPHYEADRIRTLEHLMLHGLSLLAAEGLLNSIEDGEAPGLTFNPQTGRQPNAHTLTHNYPYNTDLAQPTDHWSQVAPQPACLSFHPFREGVWGTDALYCLDDTTCSRVDGCRVAGPVVSSGEEGVYRRRGGPTCGVLDTPTAQAHARPIGWWDHCR